MDRRPGTEGALDAALDALLAGDQQSLLKAIRIIETHPRADELKRLLTSAIETREAVRAAPSDRARVQHLRMIGVACRDQERSRAVRRARDILRLRRLAFRPLAIAGASFGLLLPGTLALASTAQPGEALYGAKLKVEQVQLALTTNPESEIALHLRFAERRMDEIERLEQDGSVGRPLKAATSNLESHSAAVKHVVAAMSEEGRPTAQLTKPLERHRDGISELAGRTGCDRSRSTAGCNGLETALASSVSALERLKDGGPSPAGPSSGTLAAGEPEAPASAPAVGDTTTHKAPDRTLAGPTAPAAPTKPAGRGSTAPPRRTNPSESASPSESVSPSGSHSDPSASPSPDPSESPSPDPTQGPSPETPVTNPTPDVSTQTPDPEASEPAADPASDGDAAEPQPVGERPAPPMD